MDLAPASPRSSSFDLYQRITDQVLAMLDAGVAPWRSPILGPGSAGMPRNLHTGKPYRGINTFLLAFAAAANGYDSSHWLTFNQVRQRGGQVRRGANATMVVFWKLYETADRTTGEATRVPVLRYYNVFNVAAQCDGIDVPDRTAFVRTDFSPIDAAERIVAGYADGPSMRIGRAAAFYRPSEDAIYIPDPSRFASREDYYATLFHEHAHGTGHPGRLNRPFVAEPKPFGSGDYGREELIAEMAAAFLCGQCGLAPATLPNQAAYLWGWAHTIRPDKRLIFASAGAAQRAADWILNERGAKDE